MNDLFTLIMPLIIGYLIGSIPFGLVLCKIFGYGDIRKIGSGNIGATNVLRTGNKILALATLILDSAKGAIAVLTALFIFSKGCDFIYCLSKTCPCERFPYPVSLMAFVAGFGAIIGHCFPIWLKFKGGKGVATTLGTLLIATPIAGVVACLTWLFSAWLGKISSLAAITAMIVMPTPVYLFHGLEASLVAVAIALLVIIKHKDNIARLKNGTEPKIGNKNKTSKNKK
ncbi:MAG: glycerol-3-phosphate 1-O-acyltransferase PlsY [Pseudomonadota bacterium]